jgi:hypothetical protein
MEVFPLPLVIHPRVRKAVKRIAVMTSLAVFASTGAALAACPAPSVTTPFSQWGDTSSYFLVPGGSFAGTPAQVGWSLSNASLTAGSMPFTTTDAAGAQSLTINGAGSATSPYFCFDNTMSTLRFFARQTGAGSVLKVQGLIKTWHGVMPVTLAEVADGSMPAWAPVRQVDVPSRVLPRWATLQVALRLVVPSAAGSWQVAGVYIDPYRTN